MITAKKALQALEAAGLVQAWTISRIKSGFVYTCVSASGKVCVSEETYGNKSYLYVRGSGTDDYYLGRAQKVIREAGGKVKSWSRAPRFQFRISSIKGWHHWE